jgi:hypothetical protein
MSTMIERARAGGVTTGLAVIGYEGVPPYLLALDLVMFLAKPTIICLDGERVVAMRTDQTFYPKEPPRQVTGPAQVVRGRFWDRVRLGERRFYVRRDHRDALADLIKHCA